MRLLGRIAKPGNFQSTRVLLSLLVAATLIGSSFEGLSQERVAADGHEALRQQAVLALEDLLNDLKEYSDRALRARIRAQVADLLWTIDSQRAADLIDVAFDDAAAIDETSGGDYLSVRREARGEIIRVASRHDQKLAAKLIARVAEKSPEGAEDKTKGQINNISERGALYLESARTLLHEGEQERAIEMARRSIGEGRSGDLLWFLTGLKAKDQPAAERLFLEVLEVLRRGPCHPNDLLMLGMWLFYPNSQSIGYLNDTLPVVAYGMDFNAAPPPPTNILIPFLVAAADAVLRFPAQPGLPESLNAVELKRYVLLHLLPLYDRHMPSRAVALRAELTRLGQPSAGIDVGKALPGTRTNSDSTGGLTTEETIARIERVSDTQERGKQYLEAAGQELSRLDRRSDLDRARALANRISESDWRRLMLEMIGYRAAMKAIEGGDIEEAETIVASQLTEERQAVVALQLARTWFKRGDRARAEIQLASAQAGAAKTEDRAQRARAYIHLAGGLTDQDILRTFEFVEWAVKEINGLDKFRASGESLMFAFKLNGRNFSATSFGTSESPSLVGVMPALAKADFLRTITMLRAMKLPEPRAFSIVAACRAVMPAPRKPTPPKKV